MKVIIKRSRGFRGEIKIPGDKSISHRSAFISSLCSGSSEILNYLYCEDCLATLNCLENTGVKIKKLPDKVIIEGNRLFNFSEPNDVLNSKNSGTTARFLLGVLSGQKFFSVIDGDSSLRKRPMGRVVLPLKKMGAWIEGRKNSQNLPIAVKGNNLKGIKYKLPIPSAQLKTSLIFAGLLSDGITEIEEPIPSRDHTERMLFYFNAGIKKGDGKIKIEGKKQFPSNKIIVPGDFSSASFFITAGVLTENSEIILPEIGINPTRTGFLTILKKMGGKFKIYNKKLLCNEPVGTIVVSTSELKGIKIESEEIPLLIDEIPLIFLLATQAKGKTSVQGAKELRFKESDRIKAMVVNLRKMGIELEEKEDGFVIEGPQKLKGNVVNSFRDHRIAMTLAIAGLIAEGETVIQEFDCYRVSFPDFYSLLRRWQND